MKGAKKPTAPITRKGRKEKDDHEEPEFVAPVRIMVIFDTRCQGE